jgi:hypothetical protein
MKSFSTVLATISQLNSEYTLVRDFNEARKLFYEYVSKLNPILVRDNSVVVRAYKRDHYSVKYLTIKITLTRTQSGRALVTVEYL